MAYGLNPLFAVPLYRDGMNVPSVLLFRYAFGALMLLALMGYRKKLPVISSPRSLLFNAINGILMSFSSLFLYHSFTLIDVGLASTLLFVYQVMVAVIMALFFHEKAGGATYWPSRFPSLAYASSMVPIKYGRCAGQGDLFCYALLFGLCVIHCVYPGNPAETGAIRYTNILEPYFWHADFPDLSPI